MILMSVICGICLMVLLFSDEIKDISADESRRKIKVYRKPVITDMETLYLIKDFDEFFYKAE